MRVPQELDGLFQGKSLSRIRMMIWGYPYFRKPPYFNHYSVIMEDDSFLVPSPCYQKMLESDFI